MKLGILDADARYAGRLAAFFRAQSGGAEEPRRFDSLQALLASGEAQRLDLVLVSPERLPDPGRLPPGPLAVYLLDEPGVEARMGRPAVFRGQRAGELLRRLEDVLAQNQPMGAVLTYRLASGERLDRAALAALERNPIPGLIPVRWEEDAQVVRLQASGLTSLADGWNGRISRQKLLCFVSSFCRTALECQEYLLDLSGLLLDWKHVFADPVSGRARLAYLPVADRPAGRVAPEQFLQELIACTALDRAEDGRDTAVLADALRGGASLEELAARAGALLNGAAGRAKPDVPPAPAPSGERRHTVLLSPPSEGERTTPLTPPVRPAEEPAALYLVHKRTGRTVRLEGSCLRVGRDPGVEFCVTGPNNWLGKEHAHFQWERGRWYLVDRNSLNHTWLNGRQLDGGQPYPVQAGDVVQMADEEFQLCAL